ncbi:MAG: membrane protein insertion efficiency factor YidD [bacterium]
MRHIAIILVRLYQKTLSPDRGWMRFYYPHGYCRYQPTCSEYALRSIEEWGVWRGMFLAIARVARCHPKAPFGYDPVIRQEAS